ncbi:MAG: SH3 domain-containing protein [Polyangiaceae bacterium]|nr:SH3 domain-containing protein [Polyangiaceae bacterium]
MTSNSAKRSVGPKIEVPSHREDELRLGRVGVIAAIGFAVGIVWPRLAGLKLAPHPPEDKVSAAAPSQPSPAAPPSIPSPPEAVQTAPKAEGPVRVGELQVTSCRNADGDTQRDCGSLDLKAVLDSQLVGLGTCEAAQGIEGVLSLGLDLDLAGGAIVGVKTGKSTTLAGPTAHKLVDCARSQLSNVSLAGVEHRHAQYTVFYLLTFTPPPAPSPGDERETSPASDDQLVKASGRATVSWAVALIRDAPSTKGAVATRLLAGTRVVVTGRKGDWCRVQYDAKGREGWVYRTAIGL